VGEVGWQVWAFIGAHFAQDGSVGAASGYRAQGVLKRIAVTPISPAVFIAARRRMTSAEPERAAGRGSRICGAGTPNCTRSPFSDCPPHGEPIVDPY
jgi:hypothetical protein